jgi:hypothetical protein
VSQTLKSRLITFLQDNVFERQIRLPALPVRLAIRVSAVPAKPAQVRKVDLSTLSRGGPMVVPAHLFAPGTRRRS